MGILRGYSILSMQDPLSSSWYLGSLVEKPSLAMFVVAELATGLALFTAVRSFREKLLSILGSKWKTNSSSLLSLLGIFFEEERL